MKLLDLPNEQWANIRAASEVPEYLRRALKKAGNAHNRLLPPEVQRATMTTIEVKEPDAAADPVVQAAFGAPPVEELIQEAKNPPKRDLVEFPLSDDEIDAFDAYVTSQMLAYVDSWSFGSEITEQIATHLGGGVYDAIVKAIDADYGADKVVENENELTPTTP